MSLNSLSLENSGKLSDIFPFEEQSISGKIKENWPWKRKNFRLGKPLGNVMLHT